MPQGRTARALSPADADQALVLYNELTVGPPAEDAAGFLRVLGHDGTTVFGAFDGATLAAMATLHLLPNAVWQSRPYGLVENVVTRASHRRRGFGRLAMQSLLDAAQKAGAHKVMLLTGEAREAAGFYTALGFSDREKRAMVIRYP